MVLLLQTSRESLKVELLADVYLLPGEERIIGKCECSFIKKKKKTPFNHYRNSPRRRESGSPTQRGILIGWMETVETARGFNRMSKTNDNTFLPVFSLQTKTSFTSVPSVEP